MQAPATHADWPMQRLPHCPQLLLSDLVSTQRPLHCE